MPPTELVKTIADLRAELGAKASRGQYPKGRWATLRRLEELVETVPPRRGD
jgi:hypothetical protein